MQARSLRPLLAALCLTLLGAAVHAQTLRLGVEGAYPPFSEIGTDGKLKGFDIDIANALCTQMKAKCEFVQVEFDAMIPALRAKKFDAIVASMSITPERQKAVDFTRNYYESGNRFIGRATDTYEITPSGLKGKKIGVQRTTIHDRFVSATFKDSTIVRYGKQDEVYLDLVAGRIDVALQDEIAGSLGFLKTPAGQGFAFRGPSFDDRKFFGDGAGIAVRKGDAVLRKQLDDALAALVADGTHQKLQAKYFTVDLTPLWARKAKQ